MSAYILIVVALATGAGSSRPVTFTQEFSSQQACETAKVNLLQKGNDMRFNLITCEKK